MKHIPRFYIGTPVKKQLIDITDPNIIEKCQKILRLESGDFVDIFASNGLYNTQITTLTKKVLELKVFNSEKIKPEELKYDITLAQALPKGQKLEELIGSNTEIGIKEFIGFGSEYSQVKTKDLSINKLIRIQKIIIEAVQQSERLHVPAFRLCKNLEEVLDLDGFDIKLIMHARKSLNTEKIDSLKLKPHFKILAIIGPEGGFSDYELDLSLQSKAHIVNFDVPVLRTENAGFAFASKLLL